MRRALRPLALIACALVAGCGGGASRPFAIPAGPGAAPAQGVRGYVRFTFSLPAKSVGAHGYRRAPREISPATASVAIVLVSVNGGAPSATQTPAVLNFLPTSPNCAPAANAVLACTVTVSGPAGNDVFAAKAYSDFDATGSLLASGSVSATIVAGQTTTAALTLNGIVARVALSVATAIVPVGFRGPFQIFVVASDASGAAILGGDPYAAPLTLSVNDPAHLTTLSATTVNGPTDAIGGTYDGTHAGANAANVTISASGAGLPASAIVPATLHVDDERGWVNGATATFAGSTTTQLVPASGTPPPATTTATATTETIATNATFQGQLGLVDAHQVERDTPSGSKTSSSTVTDVYFAFLPSAPVQIYEAGSSSQNAYGSTQVITETSSVYDELPEKAGQTWSNPGAYNSDYTAAANDPNPSQTYTASGGAYTYYDTFSNRANSTASAAIDGTGSYSYEYPNFDSNTWTIGAVTRAAGSPVIPVTETASPSGATSTTNVPDWYPGGVYPSPPFSDTYVTKGVVPIPAACSVKSSLATSATETDESYFIIDPVVGQIYTVTRQSYVTNGLGRVCLITSSTTKVYYAIGNAANESLPTGAIFIGSLLYTIQTQSVSGMQSYAAPASSSSPPRPLSGTPAIRRVASRAIRSTSGSPESCSRSMTVKWLSPGLSAYSVVLPRARQASTSARPWALKASLSRSPAVANTVVGAAGA